MANPLKMLKLKPTGFQFIQEVAINAPPARVWKAILNVKKWFYFREQGDDWANIRLEPRIGGRFIGGSKDGSIADLHGIVTRIERNKLLRINGHMGMSHLPVQNAMIWELQPRKGGKATQLRFCQRTFGYLTADIEKNFQGGWKRLFVQLKELAEKK
jgi:uncharacterized protein YndB with AHSA1/START domain